MKPPTYPKIETLFKRKEDHSLDTSQLRLSEFRIPHCWMITEKIDGTNIRVSLEKHESLDLFEKEWRVRFYGRTNNAQIHPKLLEHLEQTFTLEKMKALWLEGEYPICLYGEGYGPKIQGGGSYRSDGPSFRLFDVLANSEFWLSRENIDQVAHSLEIKTVPQLLRTDEGYWDWPIEDIVDLVRDGLESRVAVEEGFGGHCAEGVVARTDPLLFNSRGQRVMWKLKYRDFLSKSS